MASTNPAFKLPYKIIIAALLIIGIIIYSRSPFEERCTTFSDPLRIQIGQLIFQIPNAYEPLISDKITFLGTLDEKAPRAQKFISTSDKNSFQKGYCQGSNSTFKNFSVFFGLYPDDLKTFHEGRSSKFYSEETDIYGASGSIYATLNPLYRGPNPGYCEIWLSHKSRVAEKKTSAKNKAFFPYKKNDYTYYISDKVTLFGNPVVIGCSSIVEGKDKNFDSCRLLAPINGDAETQVVFTTRVFPIEQWKDFIKDYQNLLTSILEKPIDKTYTVDCQYILEDKKKTEDSANEGRIPN